MFTLDDREIVDLQGQLKTFASRAYPFATKQTVNKAAFVARGHAQEEIRENMTTRNRFTVQSIQVDMARTLNVSRQAAIVGSTADYMADQEFGGVKTKKGKQGVAIATGYSAGQEGQSERTRLPRKANKLANIRLSKRGRGKGSRIQRNFVKVKEAAASGQKYVFLDLRRGEGIFRVLGGKRKPRIKMVHDLSRPSVNIPRNPWLAPAVKQTEKQIPGIYRDALIFQLKRNKLFRG